MDRDQQFLAVAAEAINEAADALRADNERAERKRRFDFPQFSAGVGRAAALLGQLEQMSDAEQAVIDELTYRSYAHNRRLAPDISPERWGKLFGENTPAMEARYQRESHA